MTSAAYSSNSDDSLPRQSNDWRLFLRLWPYIREQRRFLWLPFILLIPLSLANALQPIFIGQAISLIRQEPVAWFLEGHGLQSGLNILVGLLLVTVTVRLTLEGWQNYLVQRVGQVIDP